MQPSTGYCSSLSHLLCAIFVTLIIINTASVQADDYTDWCWQNPPTTQNELWGVSVVDKNVIWVAGYNRTILKTTDGGDTWSIQNPPTSYNLTSVSAVDANTAWVVGSRAIGEGVILKTTDGGVTWTEQTRPEDTISPHGISAVDGNTAWSVGFGGAIIKTSDGGTIWSAQTSGTTQILLSVSAVDNDTAWAAGYNGTILKTTNGGSTWVTQSSDTAVNLWSITAADRNYAWAVGSGGVITLTKDGGETWKHQIIAGTPEFRGSNAVDVTHAWAVGQYGIVYATTNGTDWVQQSIPAEISSIHLNGVCAFDTKVVWAVGTYGTIIRTTDGGSTWDRQSSEMDVKINNTDLDMIDKTTAWMVGYENGTEYGRIYKTTDAGFSWTRQDTPDTITHLYALAVANAQTAWSTGYKGYTWKTTNGETWSQLTTPSFETGSMSGISAADENTVWQVGSSGTIWNTTNGSTFEAQTSPTSYDLHAVHAVSPSIAYAVGKNGTIIKTTNGSSWNFPTSITPATSNDFSGVYAVDATTAWAVGEVGIIYKTTDGENWNQQTSPTGDYLMKVWAYDANNAWAVADHGNTIIRTIDGETWDLVPSILSSTINMNGITGVAPQSVWAVGTVGTVVHTHLVTSADPAQGPRGRLITINGSGFGTTKGTSFVSFEGVEASAFGSWSDTRITCYVPSGVPEGATEVWVQTPWGMTNKIPFTIEPLAVPHIDTLDPAACQTGREVVISGTGFGLLTDQSLPYVTFGSTPATTYNLWTNTLIKVIVPDGIAGSVQVNVHTAGGTSNHLIFSVRNVTLPWLLLLLP